MLPVPQGLAARPDSGNGKEKIIWSEKVYSKMGPYSLLGLTIFNSRDQI